MKQRFVAKEEKFENYIYDIKEQMNLGIYETADLLNYLIERNKELEKENKELQQRRK